MNQRSGPKRWTEWCSKLNPKVDLVWAPPMHNLLFMSSFQLWAKSLPLGRSILNWGWKPKPWGRKTLNRGWKINTWGRKTPNWGWKPNTWGRKTPNWRWNSKTKWGWKTKTWERKTPNWGWKTKTWARKTQNWGWKTKFRWTMGLGNYILLWTQLKFFHLSGYWPRHEIIILSQADNNRCGTKAKQIVYDKRRHLWCLWPSLQRQYIITPRLIITSSLSNIDLFKTKKKLFSRNLILKFFNIWQICT